MFNRLTSRLTDDQRTVEEVALEGLGPLAVPSDEERASGLAREIDDGLRRIQAQQRTGELRRGRLGHQRRAHQEKSRVMVVPKAGLPRDHGYRRQFERSLMLGRGEVLHGRIDAVPHAPINLTGEFRESPFPVFRRAIFAPMFTEGPLGQKLAYAAIQRATRDRRKEFAQDRLIPLAMDQDGMIERPSASRLHK